jgi:hypothetical protein
MPKYALIYKGGGVPESDAEREALMAAWGNWFGSLGSAVADPGNPFGPSASVSADGSVSDGASSCLTGYSVITADTLEAAAGHAKGCPVLASGGDVEVYETFEVT